MRHFASEIKFWVGNLVSTCAAQGNSPAATPHPVSLPLRTLAITCLLAALHLGPSAALAADPPAKAPDLADLRAATDAALLKLSMGNSTAFDALFKAHWWDRDQVDTAATEMRQGLQRFLPELNESIGKPIPGAVEFLGSIRLGEHLLSFGYLLRHEWSPFQFQFKFLHRDGHWQLNNVALGQATGDLMLQFLRRSRPSELPLDSKPKADPAQPASLALLRQACESELRRFAAGETSGFCAKLMQDHFVSPANVTEQIAAIKAKYALESGNAPFTLARPVPDRIEFLGLNWLGTNRAFLYFSQHSKQGAQIWSFSLYRPTQAWRFVGLGRNELSAPEHNLLRDLRPPHAPLPATERPLADVLERTMARVARSAPDALDELTRQHWIKARQSDEVARILDDWTANLPLLTKNYGNSLSPGQLFLGSFTEGADLRTYVYVNLREKGPVPVVVNAIHTDGRWQWGNYLLGESAAAQLKLVTQFERRYPTPDQPAQPPKPLPPNLAALGKSCDLFMTRVSQGKLGGSLEELARRHQPASAKVLQLAREEESKWALSSTETAKETGKPISGQFACLGWGRCGPFLVQLLYQQHHERAMRNWEFIFYQTNKEWHLASVAYPGDNPWEAPYLPVIQHANPLPKAE